MPRTSHSRYSRWSQILSCIHTVCGRRLFRNPSKKGNVRNRDKKYRKFRICWFGQVSISKGVNSKLCNISMTTSLRFWDTTRISSERGLIRIWKIRNKLYLNYPNFIKKNKYRQANNFTNFSLILTLLMYP